MNFKKQTLLTFIGLLLFCTVIHSQETIENASNLLVMVEQKTLESINDLSDSYRLINSATTILLINKDIKLLREALKLYERTLVYDDNYFGAENIYDFYILNKHLVNKVAKEEMSAYGYYALLQNLALIERVNKYGNG